MAPLKPGQNSSLWRGWDGVYPVPVQIASPRSAVNFSSLPYSLCLPLLFLLFFQDATSKQTVLLLFFHKGFSSLFSESRCWDEKSQFSFGSFFFLLMFFALHSPKSVYLLFKTRETLPWVLTDLKLYTNPPKKPFWSWKLYRTRAYLLHIVYSAVRWYE